MLNQIFVSFGNESVARSGLAPGWLRSGRSSRGGWGDDLHRFQRLMGVAYGHTAGVQLMWAPLLKLLRYIPDARNVSIRFTAWLHG